MGAKANGKAKGKPSTKPAAKPKEAADHPSSPSVPQPVISPADVGVGRSRATAWAIAAAALLVCLVTAVHVLPRGEAAAAHDSSTRSASAPLPTAASSQEPQIVEPTSTSTSGGSPMPTAPAPAPLLPSRELTGEFVIVRSFAHDPSAFTQGLVVVNHRMFESTGLVGRSTLREVDPADGRVLRKVSLPSTVFGEGLAIVGSNATVLTWQSKVLYRYDVETFGKLGSRSFQTVSGEGWGLTFDGESLVVSDGSSSLLFWDPVTLARQRRVVVRDGPREVTWLNELEWVLGEVLANVWHDHRVARIDPVSGAVLSWLDMSPLGFLPYGGDRVLNGIACDSSTEHDEDGVRCFFTGKLWDKMFEIRLLTRPRSSASSAASTQRGGWRL